MPRTNVDTAWLKALETRCARLEEALRVCIADMEWAATTLQALQPLQALVTEFVAQVPEPSSFREDIAVARAALAEAGK